MCLILINLGRADEGRPYIKAALAANPSDPTAQYLLQQLGDPDTQPRIIFEKASGKLIISEELLNKPAVDLAVMITAAVLKAHPAEAQEMLQSIVEEKGLDFAQRVAEIVFPGSVRKPEEQNHFEKAEELFKARLLPEAIEEYKLAIAADRDHAMAYMGIGDCYYHLGQFNLATAFFEESVLIQPNHSTFLFLGDAHLKAGRMEKAIRAYEQALELNPSYEIARQQLRDVREQMREKRYA